MGFDSLVVNPGRLRILTSLAVEERQEFVRLRRATQLTDGNLASHARRLESGGLIAIEKQIRDGKPVTHLTLTSEGRRALEAHARRLVAAISHRRLSPAPAPEAKSLPTDEEEYAPVASASTGARSETMLEEEWVD